MSGKNETPRQKMIGMMYLVYTALLALNVSTDILKSFLVVNKAIETTVNSFTQKVDGAYNLIEAAYLVNPTKTQNAWDKAKIVKEKSAALRQYLENIRVELIAVCEGVPVEQAKNLTAYDIKRQDNYDDPSRYFCGDSEDGSNGEAHVLKGKLDEYRKEMNQILGEDSTKVVLDALRTDGQYAISWEMEHFYHMIVVADLAMVNRFLSEVLNAEYGVVSQLYSGISANDFKFDQIEARVVPKSNYVFIGQQFEAEIFVAAFDSKSNLSATIAGNTYPGENGIVHFKRAASSLGEQKISGMISLPGAYGIKEYPFETSYIVAEPTATVSADAMNVLYVGVDNPLSALAAGVADAKTRVTMTNGTLTKVKAGKYVARVTQPGAQAVVSVFDMSSGKEQLMGSMTYRVKRVPDPVARINGQEEGTKNIDKNTLANAGGLLVSMKDFEFQLSLKVASFSLQISKGQELTNVMRSSSNRFTDDMVQNIQRCKRGDKIFIQDIMAAMPDGNRALGDMILTIK